MSGCPDVAEDLAQEVLLLAFLHRDQFRGHSDIRTWLYIIARRAYSRMIRRRAGQPRTMIVLSGSRANSVGDFPPRELCDHREDPYERMCRIERQAFVRDAIARLPPKLRLPLTLNYLNEVSIKEIAALLEVEENTVKTRLHRARRRLALELRRGGFLGDQLSRVDHRRCS